MARGRIIAAGMGLTMLLGAGAAHADEASPRAPQTTPQQAAAPPGEPPRPPGTVRLHVRSFKPSVPARLFVGRADGSYSFVCQAPCKADVVPGTPLRVTIGDSEVGHDFPMSATAGNEVDLEVRPASKGPIAGGVVMISIGGVTAGLGVILTAVGGFSHNEETSTAGYVCLGIGGALTVGGIALIANRSREPRIRTNEHAPGTAASRADLFSGDIASLRPRSPIAPAFAPLQLSATF
jgi:hypothetical protein